MKLATTIADFSSCTDNAKDAVRLCREAGFTNIDYSFAGDFSRGDGSFSPDWRAYLAELKQLTAELGVTFVQAHAPMGTPIVRDGKYESFLAANRRCIEACGILGIPNIVIHSGYEKGLTKEETFARNKAFYSELLDTAEASDVTILTENFNKMCIPGMYWVDNAKDEQELIDYIGHPRLRACWDAGHGNMNERSQDESLRILGDRVYALHVQDNLGSDDHHFAPFFGTLNLDSLMHGLSEIGYRGYFTFEACHMMRSAEQRNRYPADTRLAEPPLSLRLEAEKLLYHIGEYILSSYDCLER